MGKRKRKYISDGVDVLQSFSALEGSNNTKNKVHTLILGTMPSDKSFGNELSPKDIILRGGSGPQNYGHARNCFWNIVGSAFGFQRHRTPYAKQIEALTSQGYAVWDVLQSAQRKGSLDSNIVKESQIPNDIPKFILDHSDLNRLVFAANSAEIFSQKKVWGEWLETGVAMTRTTAQSPKDDDLNNTNAVVRVQFWMQDQESNPDTFSRTHTIFGKKKGVVTASNVADVETRNQGKKRPIELVVMPSTSPANASNRPPEKERKWHRACYGMREPSKEYICPGCELVNNQDKETSPFFGKALSSTSKEQHWFHDCPYREEWKRAKKNTKKMRAAKAPTNIEDIDPFDWYM
mmetsp:Transcript_16063/g.24289  ORF Transcript_16063/g.24289 Transcript_16063/m.24289 type:complete len:349 (+) Transcript_16063:132-1178(+)